jgi:hypothetical protein
MVFRASVAQLKGETFLPFPLSHTMILLYYMSICNIYSCIFYNNTN